MQWRTNQISKDVFQKDRDSTFVGQEQNVLILPRSAGTILTPLESRSILNTLLLALLIILFAGCASPGPAPAKARRFDFSKDTFAYANGLVWEYRYDENGKWVTRRRDPRPAYSQHCFVVSRSACQFFENASFQPGMPKVDDQTYRLLIRRVVNTSLKTPLNEEQKIIFPGYPDLRSFSKEHEKLLQSECGGAWRCYFQRGNWRMIFPFSREEQAHVAEQLQQELEQRGAKVVHVVRFPQLTINHAVLLVAAKPNPNGIEFLTYDPNEPDAPVTLSYWRDTKTFYLPPNAYFPGGRVDIYPIYDRAFY
jgi:hypothetical protein